jgi:acyl carrier protein
LGRLWPDGCLEYIGRKDFQVKIRGHRVELGEIEVALLDHPGIKDAVVLAREDGPDAVRLVAYIVLVQKPGPTSLELRNCLRDRVPDHKVPSGFVMLDALPLLPSGKVNRQALPQPQPTRSLLEAAFVSPRTPVEEVLARIWGQVLGLEQVGIHDNFFELGGHSLLATQVIARLRAAFQVELPLRALFKAPTIAGLALTTTQRLAEQANRDEIVGLLAELEGV